MPGTARQMAFADYCRWCKENGFDGVDVCTVTDEIKQDVDAAGLEIGTSDLMTLGGLFGSDDEAERTVNRLVETGSEGG